MNSFLRNYLSTVPKSKSIYTVAAISVIYLVIISLLIGLKLEHWLIVVFFNACFFAATTTRRFILAFSIFMVYWIIYDLMKVFPNYEINSVDIQHLYNFEKNTFGIHYNNSIVTLNEFFASKHNTFLDILAGLFYINWVPVPLAFAIYLFIKNKQQFLHFSLAFFLVNILGFILYYVHPAAPPWYIKEYGFILNTDVPGNTAELSRFDQLLHLPVFATIYSRNSNVFAAFPSLHCAYPVIVLFYAIKNKLGKINWAFGLFMAGIWFAAIYSGHHYVTDVIMGVICAVAGIFILHRYLLKTASFSAFLNKYQQAISPTNNEKG
jgi:membrane-associated phospholipid phosphatase